MAVREERQPRPAVHAGIDGAAVPGPESEHAWLAAIVDFSSDAVLSKRPDGTITSWNAAAERMYGYPAADAIGRSIEIIVPEDRRDELRGMDERLARGERVPPFETERVTRDGRRIDVALTMSPIIDHTGAVVGASGIARDISERRRAEEALRRSQAQLKDFVETQRSACTGSGPTATFSGRTRPSSTCSATRVTNTSGGTSRSSTPTGRRSKPFSSGCTATSN